MVKLGIALAVVAGCRANDPGGAPGTAGSGSAARPKAGSFGGHAASRAGSQEASDQGPARVKPEEPDTVEVGKQLADLGAVSAWQAVVDRTRYLARRGQHGVVFGTLGPRLLVPSPVVDAGLVASPYTWLVDDTEGNGALAIRVELGGAKASQGDRLALGGAWVLDEARRWAWQVDATTALPPAPPGELAEPPSAPGHVIVNGELEKGARTISVAKDGETVYFQLVGPPPAIDGDGWPVADELGNSVYALLNLPGERPSYGAQDLRAPDERWQLRRGQTYELRIGHIHRHGPDKTVTINARTPPVRVK